MLTAAALAAFLANPAWFIWMGIQLIGMAQQSNGRVRWTPKSGPGRMAL
jgi:hypothetical protein